jgi:small-conductance mechanosensitive channel
MPVRIPASWAIAVALGFPAALLLLNELLARARRRNSVLTATVAALRNLVLPAAGLVLLTRFVLGEPEGSAADRVALTVLWIVALYSSLTFVSDFVFGAARSGTWRANVPELLRDMVRSLLVLIGAAFIYSEVWGKELAGALTALGLGSLVIGLALQEPLGNVFSGIMLMFERPVSMGDWIRVAEGAGRVVGMNWRAIQLETLTRELVVVPNSSLYKTSFVNLSRPTRVRTETLDMGFSFDDAPNDAKRMLLEVVRQTPGVLADPPPTVWTHAYGEYAITYRVLFSVASQDEVHEIRDEVLTRIWYSTRRAGLTIPYPIATEVQAELKDIEGRQPDPARLLAAHPRFQLSPRELEAVRTLHFGAGEMLLTEGDEQDGLCLIVAGQALLTARGGGGESHEVARLGPGDFYGEHSILAGQASPLALQAVNDVTVLLFDLDTSRRLVESSAQLAREVGETIDRRQRAVQTARRGRAGH